MKQGKPKMKNFYKLDYKGRGLDLSRIPGVNSLYSGWVLGNLATLALSLILFLVYPPVANILGLAAILSTFVCFISAGILALIDY